MQLQDIRSEIRIAAGFDTTDTIASNAQLNSLINRAIRIINGKRDWDWRKANETITTVANQASYARDAAAIRTIRIEDIEQGDLLEMITPEAAARYNDFNGRPVFWFIENDRIWMIPKPEGVRTFKHVYLRSETTLSGDTDEPLIPDDVIDTVILHAATALLARADDTSQSRLLDAQYRQALDSAERNARRAKGSPIIKSRRDWNRPGKGV